MANIRDIADLPTPDEEHDGDGSSSDPAWLEASILASSTEDARAAAAECARPGDGNHRTVLVVAGDADMRTYVRGCLAHMTSVQVLEAADVPAMRGIARAMPPDLVVVDVEGESADTAVDRMMGLQPELVSVPVIVITDDAPGNDRGSIGSRNAAGAFLVKPFNARRLCAEVDRFLSIDSES